MREKVITVFTVIILLTICIFSSLSVSAVELEIFSWWTAEGEKEGLQALFDTYRVLYPESRIKNATVAGGAGSKAKDVLKTRMLDGNPPDSFQVHGGPELINTWVMSGYMKPISDLWQKEGWQKIYPESIIDMISYQGEIYSVPLNIHRSNLLWYNKKIFTKYNIIPPTTLNQFFKVVKKLKSKGVTPLALSSKNKWPVTHLFETILAGVAGPHFYKKLVKGKASWRDENVLKSLRILKEIFKYANDNSTSLTWDGACQLVLDGQAAMTIMGSWAAGYFKANSAVLGEDYNFCPVPETGNYFIVLTDTFGLPVNAPHPKRAVNWLQVIGSAKAQVKASSKMGSIPVRIDISSDNFGPFIQAQISAYRNLILLPSIGHGAAVINTFAKSINDQFGIFLYQQNPEKTAKRLEKLARDFGVYDNN